MIGLNEGEWRIEVFAETVDKPITKIFEYNLISEKSQLEYLANGGTIFFDWAPNLGNYVSRIDDYGIDQTDLNNITS
ncbi:hypothetical protein LZD49_17660 [Dyadobacter sp. CY261]|uniref:hypothetical protein n=1 Tax=Dyadobacter sp. CY261 TaxID=2907203 RepID=UPI001F33F8B0|nr:hypothetical protein [Dyadobacter sp. CY261]MCF0072312.1 hypothetical protein [Dyadobacter sp. CY261]